MLPRRLLAGIPVLLGAFLAAFFLSFAGVFTDAAPGLTGERLLSLGLSLAGHLILGLLGVRLVPGSWVGWGFAVAAPSLLLLAWYAIREPSATILCAVYTLVAVVGGLGGARLGARRPAAA